LAHHRAREPVWGWLFYVFTGGLLNTKAWGYVTDVLGGAVYVVYVDCVEVVRRLDAPIAWPHTVIFVDRGVAERLRPAMPPRIVYNRLVSGRGGSLLAEHYTRDLGKAPAIAERLKSAGLRPNVVK
jgi:hypothetical protein